MNGPDDQAFREAYGEVVPEFNPDEARQLWGTGSRGAG